MKTKSIFRVLAMMLLLSVFTLTTSSEAYAQSTAGIGVRLKLLASAINRENNQNPSGATHAYLSRSLKSRVQQADRRAAADEDLEWCGVLWDSCSTQDPGTVSLKSYKILSSSGKVAKVKVVFNDSWWGAYPSLTLKMVYEGGNWYVDNIFWSDGGSLRNDITNYLGF